jgi:hypothetical protein
MAFAGSPSTAAVVTRTARSRCCPFLLVAIIVTAFSALPP